MPPTQIPEVPDSLNNLKPYLKLAAMYDERDIVVAYWFRLEAIQQGLGGSTKSMEETQFFMKLMQWLEETKKANHENEAITNDIVAQAHLENVALKLFLWADENDRAGVFNKGTIQAFYTSGAIYQLMKTFGPLNEEAERNMKYAKWKSVYINNCLKKGETPVPGPLQTEDNENNEDSNVDDMEEITMNEDDEYLDAVAKNFTPENEEEEGENDEKPDEEKPGDGNEEKNEEKPDDENEEKNEEKPDDENEENNEEKPDDENEEKPEENNENPEVETEQENEEEKKDVEDDLKNEDNKEENEEANDQINEKPKDETEEDNDENEAGSSKSSNHVFPSVPSSSSDKPTNEPTPKSPTTPVTPNPPYNPAPTPTSEGSKVSFDSTVGGVELSFDQMERAKKLIKWAGSALNYDDVSTAITNLQQALNLLSTGQENA